MASDRKLLVGAVSLVQGEVPDDISAGTQARDEVTELLGPEYFEGAPFQQIGVIIRYGEHTNLGLEYVRLQAKQSYLDISVRVEMALLQRAADSGDLVALFRQALIEALIAVAWKYERPCEPLLAVSRPELFPRQGGDPAFAAAPQGAPRPARRRIARRGGSSSGDAPEGVV